MDISDYDNEYDYVEKMGFEFMRKFKPAPYKPIINKDQVLTDLYPHYMNHPAVFNGGREVLIFGDAETKGMIVEYGDRLRSFDLEADKNAYEQMKLSNTRPRTARWFEEWLSIYYGRPVTLHAIWTGYNVGNGYPYAAFGFHLNNK